LLLGQFNVFDSRDLNEIARFLRDGASGELREAKLLAGGRGFRCNAIVTNGLTIFSLSSDLSASFVFEPVDYIRLVFQTRRRSRVVLPGLEFEVTPGDVGYFLPVGQPATEVHPEGFRSFGIRIDLPSLQRQLGALIGQQFEGTIDFEQPRNTDQRFIEFVRRPLIDAARELDLIGPQFARQILTELETVTLTRLLLFARHSRSVLLQAEYAAPDRSNMSRAEEFVALNWDRPIDVKAIAQAAGVSTRTVLRYFQQKFGETPRAHLRRLRLEKARQMLLTGSKADSVVAVALRCGFSSLGHFAESYQRKFGELPSVTLKQKR